MDFYKEELIKLKYGNFALMDLGIFMHFIRLFQCQFAFANA